MYHFMACFVFHGQSLNKGHHWQVIENSLLLSLPWPSDWAGRERQDEKRSSNMHSGPIGKEWNEAKAHSGSWSKATYPNLPLPPSSLPHPLDDDLFHEGWARSRLKVMRFLYSKRRSGKRRKAGVIVQRNGPPKCKKKIGKLIVPGGSKKNWGLSSLSLSPREIPPRHLPCGRSCQVC